MATTTIFESCENILFETGLQIPNNPPPPHTSSAAQAQSANVQHNPATVWRGTRFGTNVVPCLFRSLTGKTVQPESCSVPRSVLTHKEPPISVILAFTSIIFYMLFMSAANTGHVSPSWGGPGGMFMHGDFLLLHCGKLCVALSD